MFNKYSLGEWPPQQTRQFMQQIGLPERNANVFNACDVLCPLELIDGEDGSSPPGAWQMSDANHSLDRSLGYPPTKRQIKEPMEEDHAMLDRAVFAGDAGA